jgi:hypothetical protein
MPFAQAVAPLGAFELGRHRYGDHRKNGPPPEVRQKCHTSTAGVVTLAPWLGSSRSEKTYLITPLRIAGVQLCWVH